MVRRICFFFFVCLLAGCVSRAGLEEFTVYKRAFDDSRSVSTALIDRLAAAERAVGRFAHFSPNDLGVDPNFSPERAVYFSDQADPPLAAEYRRAMVTINQYNELMLAFATGRGFDDIVSQLDQLVGEAVGLAAPLSGRPLALTSYRAVLGSIIAFGAAERSRAAFQSKFRETKPTLLNLIGEMKAQTPTAFQNLTFFVEADIRNVQRGLRQGDVAALRATHMEARVLLSDWVILLDRHAAAIEATQRVVDNPRLGTVLSGTAEAMIQLRLTVESIRSHLAETRAR